MMTASRQVSYQWRLREVMAAHGLFNATDLVPLLAERGIRLSSVQVWRLVTQTPERLSLPVLAASPPPSAGPAASGQGPVPKASRGPKASEAPEIQVTIRGQVASTTDAKGRPEFTLATSGKTLRLSAGPPWFFGTKNPLMPFVGKTVTIVGEQSGDEIDVISVDGTVIRAPGKPPWAGGWKQVGKSHPGWSQAKADRQAAKQKAKAACIASGQCKDDAGEPDESAEPSETPGAG